MGKDKLKLAAITITELPQVQEDSESKGFLRPDEEPYAAIGSKALLPIVALNPESRNFDKKHAYFYGNYLYLFNGACPRVLARDPGIYYDSTEDCYFIIEHDPNNPESDIYKATEDHIFKLNPITIARSLQDEEETIYARQRASSRKIYHPVIGEKDDLLKRAIKQALIEKGIDLDQCRQNFENKNSLFNFKQVLKSDGKMTILVFQRGADAFNLRVVVSLEEIDPEHPIGEALKAPIVVSSTDNFRMSGRDPGDTNTIKIGIPDASDEDTDEEDAA